MGSGNTERKIKGGSREAHSGNNMPRQADDDEGEVETCPSSMRRAPRAVNRKEKGRYPTNHKCASEDHQGRLKAESKYGQGAEEARGPKGSEWARTGEVTDQDNRDSNTKLCPRESNQPRRRTRHKSERAKLHKVQMELEHKFRHGS